MNPSQHDLGELFAQLGLPDDEASIRRFVAEHGPLPTTLNLPDAPFWTPAQAAFLREGFRDDADWAPTVDTLNAMLRHPG